VGAPGQVSPTGIRAQANATSTGDAGRVLVRAGSLALSRNGQIGTSTFGRGAAGDVEIDVSGPVVIEGTGTGDRLTGIGSQAESGSIGTAGRVAVRAGTVTIINEGDISSATAGPGRGGDVSVTTSSEILLTGPGSRITTLSTGAGEAGSVAVSAPRVVLRGGGASRLRHGQPTAGTSPSARASCSISSAAP
jgi:hypothetical protein